MRAKGEMEISVALWAIEAREETLLFTLLLYRSIACECDMSKHATAEPDAAKYNVSLIYVRWFVLRQTSRIFVNNLLQYRYVEYTV